MAESMKGRFKREERNVQPEPGRVERGRKKRNLFLLRVGGQCTVKRTSIPMAGLSNVPASLHGTGTSIPGGGPSNISASLYGDGYQHHCPGMDTGIPAGGLSNVPASLCGERYQHPYGGTVKHTSIPAWRQVPASPGKYHPTTLRTSLAISSPATLLTHNPKAMRPGGKLKQGETPSQGSMLPGHQDAHGSLAGEATGLVSLHAQLVLLGRCFWPLYRVRKNLSTQWPSPTTHHVFLKASAPRVKGFTWCLEKYFQLLSQQGKLENRTLRNSHSPVGEGNRCKILVSQNGKIFIRVSILV